MLISLGEVKTPIYFSSLGQKSKLHDHIVKQWFPLIILRVVYHRFFILHMLIGLGADMIPIEFEFSGSKVKVTRVFCK